MVKNLVLLRHSDAQFSYDTADYERKLTLGGEEKCFLVGRWFQRNGLEPQKVLCSTAQRTRATLQGFVEYFSKETEVVFENSLYEADLQDLLQVVQRTTENVETLLLVCHEPAVSFFAKYLVNPKINPNEVAKLVLPYFPLTLSYFVLDGLWENLPQGAAVLQEVVTLRV